ncbi:MAG: MFS transporter [Pseudomonadota bacterium]
MNTTASPAPSEKQVSAWTPFAHGGFTLLWTATLVSNIGTWMHDVGAGWLMTTLTPSPATVALVQAATTAPIFLFALFAGALADCVDKKKLLIIVNIAMAITAGLMTLAVQSDMMSPALLIIFTFALGAGAAFIAPAWQAVVPSLVPRSALQPAIALNSMGINIARAIGPAVAGFLIASVGLVTPFLANLISLLIIIIALLAWKSGEKSDNTLPPEPLFGAMLTGLRHALYNDALKATLARALGFFVSASAYWALLPLIAKGIDDNLLGGGAQLYGILLTSTGAAAVIGALILPSLRKSMSASTLVSLGTLGTAGALLILALAPYTITAILGSLLAGVSWIAVLTSLNVSAQTSLPNWVRARGLAVLLMVFFGSMTIGSTVWGQVAEQAGISVALGTAAASLLVALPILRNVELGGGENLDLTPALHWAALPPLPSNSGDRGPVLVTIDYIIDPDDEAAFLSAIHSLKDERFRDGAYDWGIGQSAENSDQWTEYFLVSSWLEHERQHARVTHADKNLQADVRKFHKGDMRPRVSHLIAPVKDRGSK